jgi:hypothetical protein
MIPKEKKESYLLLISHINNCLCEGLNFNAVRDTLLELEDLIEETKQIPTYIKSDFLVRIQEVRSELSLKTEAKAIIAFDNLVINLFRYLRLRLPKGTLRERINRYLYPDLYDED